jgi:hypothetical protein
MAHRRKFGRKDVGATRTDIARVAARLPRESVFRGPIHNHICAKRVADRRSEVLARAETANAVARLRRWAGRCAHTVSRTLCFSNILRKWPNVPRRHRSQDQSVNLPRATNCHRRFVPTPSERQAIEWRFCRECPGTKGPPIGWVQIYLRWRNHQDAAAYPDRGFNVTRSW